MDAVFDRTVTGLSIGWLSGSTAISIIRAAVHNGQAGSRGSTRDWSADHCKVAPDYEIRMIVKFHIDTREA